MFDISDEYCRTCMCQVLGDTEMTLNSFTILESLGLAEKIEQCCSLKVQPCDGYPSRVCEICFVKISDFYEFQQMCQQSLRRFDEIQQQECKLVETDKSNREKLIEHIEKDRVIEDKEIVIKSEYVSVDDNDRDSFSELTDSVDVLEEVNIERLYLEAEVNLNDSRLKSEPAETSANLDGIELATKENMNKKSASFTSKHNAKNKSNKEDRTNPMSDSLSSYEEHFECLSDREDGQEFFSEDCESALDEESEKSDTRKRLQCSFCPKRFLIKRCLEGHMRTHQGLLDHPCPRENCGRSYRRLCDLKQHLRVHDGLPREYRCVRGGCDRIYNHYRDLLLHRVEEHGAPQVFKCDKDGCSKEFKSKTYLKSHMEKRHSDGPQKPPESHMCDTCGAVLRSVATLRVHTLIHVDRSEWPFVCDEKACLKRFRTHQQLTIHKNRHAGIKNYPCPHCDMRFVTSTNLKNHINTHTWERTWTCKFCPKICNTPDLLRKHTENKHGIIKRYTCSICNRHFNSSNAKMYHEMSHVGGEAEIQPTEGKQDRFRCDYCDRTFESQSRKKSHEMIHTGEKPHVCEECGKKFRTTIQLKTHKRSHMKVLPRDFVCSVCDRAFFSAQSMRHHEMKHTKEKPYKCEECGFSFRWPNNLSRHRKLHLRDKNLNENTQEEECVEVVMEDS